MDGPTDLQLQILSAFAEDLWVVLRKHHLFFMPLTFMLPTSETTSTPALLQNFTGRSYKDGEYVVKGITDGAVFYVYGEQRFVRFANLYAGGRIWTPKHKDVKEVEGEE